jgi:hypothetical protein
MLEASRRDGHSHPCGVGISILVAIPSARGNIFTSDSSRFGPGTHVPLELEFEDDSFTLDWGMRSYGEEVICYGSHVALNSFHILFPIGRTLRLGGLAAAVFTFSYTGSDI